MGINGNNSHLLDVPKSLVGRTFFKTNFVSICGQIIEYSCLRCRNWKNLEYFWERPDQNPKQAEKRPVWENSIFAGKYETLGTCRNPWWVEWKRRGLRKRFPLIILNSNISNEFLRELIPDCAVNHLSNFESLLTFLISYIKEFSLKLTFVEIATNFAPEFSFPPSFSWPLNMKNIKELWFQC